MGCCLSKKRVQPHGPPGEEPPNQRPEKTIRAASKDNLPQSPSGAGQDPQDLTPVAPRPHLANEAAEVALRAVTRSNSKREARRSSKETPAQSDSGGVGHKE